MAVAFVKCTSIQVLVQQTVTLGTRRRCVCSDLLQGFSREAPVAVAVLVQEVEAELGDAIQ